MLLESLRAEVCALHQELPDHDLVVWTMGNVSARDPEMNLVVIKPSGIRFRDLRPENMIVVDLDGNLVEGQLKPSSDTASHCYIYRQRPETYGIVHTHSRFATAFAALGRPIPCVLTGMADEFGGDIPCGGFALIGGEQIGQVVIETLRRTRSPAVLLQNHGVFTVGKNAEAAVKAAVMAEDSARTIWTALQIGTPLTIDPADLDKLHYRYTHIYGQ